MALRINTNITALAAHKNLIHTDNKMSESLGRLSSGLRINKAADDASGMSIADSLKSQALGLGQAIRNANDGINIVQTADAALQESINIINTIKTKAIQAAQDGQTTESRSAIQSDIDKLMEELDNIAKTTSFNNQKLLSGNFTNKEFQIGAYSGETVGVSIGSGESTKLGHITQRNLSLLNDAPGNVELGIYSNSLAQTFLTESVEVAYDNTSENSMGAVADAINKLSDKLGINANAVVKATTDYNVQEGTTDADFAINGIAIGQINVLENDSNGALVSAINSKTSSHGIVASVDSAGYLTLTSTDERAIQVTGTSITDQDQSAGVHEIFSGTDMSTLGFIQLNQTGASEIRINDVGSGNSVALTNTLEVAADTSTSIESTLANGSRLASGSILSAGWTTNQAINVSSAFDQSLALTQDSTLAEGSILGSSTILNAGSVFGGETTVAASGAADITTTGTATIGNGSIILASSTINQGTIMTGEATISGVEAITTGTAFITNGSTLASGSTLGAGTVFGGTVTTSATNINTLAGDGTIAEGSTLSASSILNIGTILASGETFSIVDNTSYGATFVGDGTALTENIQLDGAHTFTQGDVAIENGSRIGSGSTLAAGTVFDSDNIKSDNNTDIVLSQSMTLETNSSVGGAAGGVDSILKSGSYFDNNDVVLSANLTLSADMTLSTGSTIVSGSTMAAGTTFLADNVRLTDDMTLTQDSELTIGSNINQEASIIGAGSTIGAQASLGNDISITDTFTMAANSTIVQNTTIANGSSLGANITTNSAETVSATSDMFIAEDSTLKDGTVLAEGTYLTNDIVATDGMTYTTGTVLVDEITLDGDQTLTRGMTLESGSVIAKGSILAAHVGVSAGATSDLSESELYRLSDLKVLTQEDAQTAITVADAALKDLDKIRADIGSVQNQLASTISNISTTQVNVQAAESTIRDVDFAEESANFTKMQILQQAGTFAMAQANASAQAVLSLLQ